MHVKIQQIVILGLSVTICCIIVLYRVWIFKEKYRCKIECSLQDQIKGVKRMEQDLRKLIKKCDEAIKNEDFDTLINYYTDDAILVVKPGMIAKGKDEIKRAFIKIAKYFNNSIVPTQGEMVILEAGDTALVISQTILNADIKDSEFSMDRRATYVFKKRSNNQWLCAIDNSYGTELINN